ncbi:hypothetical protein EVAR_84981_1 [Eumeta japonica]|uniref:Uncharacterized protein n=1 Tax=Eumeta variegata TaxID=151549 RepID=A0A4C1WA43_EUMVA|nr:hypothetical protein EVAR_84981_1 [Eumeta japonica]
MNGVQTEKKLRIEDPESRITTTSLRSHDRVDDKRPRRALAQSHYTMGSTSWRPPSQLSMHTLQAVDD